MKNTELKVGYSFEVVKVLPHIFIGDVFKIGGHTIEFSSGHNLLNGRVNSKAYELKHCFGQQALFLPRIMRKPIGKLTITKLK